MAEAHGIADPAEPPLVLHTRVVSQTGGGPDKTILNSPRFLRRLGYQAICAYMRHPRDEGFRELERMARRWQAPILGVDDHGPLDWRIVGRFREICARHAPLIWHGHDYKSNLIGLLARRSHPMALVTTVHGWGVQRTWKTPFYYSIDRYCLRFYDSILCVSEDLLNTSLAAGVPPERCRLVANAIDTDEYRRRESPPAARERLGMASERLVIGAVGRLSKEKGFDLLIRAVDASRRAGNRLELWLIGEGAARAELEALVSELGADGWVRLLGHRSAMVDLYGGLDVLAISSLSEGLPNVLLEAMAVGLPVLATRCGGIPSLVEDGRNGLLVEPGSVATLSEGLDRLARSADLRRRLGDAARVTIERSYSFAERMRTISSIYDRLLTDKPRI